jgi:hypothetical protein
MATITQTSRHPFRDSLSSLDGSVPTKVVQALRSVVTALEYADRPLVRSQIETAKATMVEDIEAFVAKVIKLSQQHRFDLRVGWGEVGGHPSQASDEAGKAIETDLNCAISTLIDVRDNLLGDLQSLGLKVQNEETLHTEIAEMKAFQSSFIGSWPWSSNPLPASDKAMLARGRAGSLRGEGIPIEDLIRQVEAGK